MSTSRVPTCHPERKHKARGLCGPCYGHLRNSGGELPPKSSPRRPGCHPDRTYYSTGLCKSCYNGALRKRPDQQARNDEYQRRYRANPATRERRQHNVRDWTLRSKYGIGVAEFNQLLDAQGGVCAICRQPESRLGKGGDICPLCVDHDHATGAVRGLLCSGCNVAIHKAESVEGWFSAAASYLHLR